MAASKPRKNTASTPSNTAQVMPASTPAPSGVGITDLKNGVLFSLIGSVVGIAAVIFLYVGIIAAAAVAVAGTAVAPTPGLVAPTSGIPTWALIPFAIIFVAAMALGVVAILKMRKGFIAMAATNQRFKIGATGSLLALIGGILAAAGLLLFLSAAAVYGFGNASGAALPGLILMLIGSVIDFVGGLLLLISFYRVGNLYNNTLVEVGAILLVFIGLIGTILLYLGLNDIERDTGGKQQ